MSVCLPNLPKLWRFVKFCVHALKPFVLFVLSGGLVVLYMSVAIAMMISAENAIQYWTGIGMFAVFPVAIFIRAMWISFERSEQERVDQVTKELTGIVNDMDDVVGAWRSIASVMARRAGVTTTRPPP